MSDELQRKINPARNWFDAMPATERLRHEYIRHKSFARGMCPDGADLATHCKAVDTLMPDPEALTDAQIGLILMSRPWHL